MAEKEKELKLSRKLRRFLNLSYNIAVEDTIKAGKLDVNNKDYRQPDILSIVEHFEVVLDKRKSLLTGKDLLVLNCFFSIFAKYG